MTEEALVDQQAAALRAAAIEAATPCLRDRPASRRPVAVEAGEPDETTQKLMIQFKLVASGGVVAVHEATQIPIVVDRNDPVDPNVADQELADCVIAKTHALTWPAAIVDATFTITQTLSIGDLDRPAQVAPGPKPPMPADPATFPKIGELRTPAPRG